MRHNIVGDMMGGYIRKTPQRMGCFTLTILRITYLTPAFS